MSQASEELIPGVNGDQFPRHIAIIMDGNGRWAKRRHMPRIHGHRAGTKAVRAVTEECVRLGLRQLTLYGFSAENWRRPRTETDYLMRLYRRFLVQERKTILKNDVRLRMIGRRDGLPDFVLRELDTTVRLSEKNAGLVLCLAINYGSRQEIADAARALAREAAAGQLDPESVDETRLAQRLYTAGMPDPDLLIRTAGEQRISNFLLWQISYAELYVTSVLWPDFGVQDLWEAIRDYAGRERRFGALTDPSPRRGEGRERGAARDAAQADTLTLPSP